MQIVFEPEHFRSAAYDGDQRVGVAEFDAQVTLGHHPYGGRSRLQGTGHRPPSDRGTHRGGTQQRGKDRPRLLLRREDDAAEKGRLSRCPRK